MRKGHVLRAPVLVLACLFLIDPIIAFRDFLPDLFGYLLLFVGLYRLADVGDAFAECRKRVKKLIAVGVLQLLAGLLVYVFLPRLEGSMNVYESPTVILLCTFLLSVAKCYYLIPALQDLWKGFSQSSILASGCALGQTRQGAAPLARARGMGTAFVLLSSILSLLPELTLLVTFDYHSAGKTDYPDWYVGGGGTAGMDLYAYADLFRLLLGALILILGLLWAVFYLIGIRKIQRDEALNDYLDARYAAEVLPLTGMLKLRRFDTSFLLLKIGAVFSVIFPIYFREASSDGTVGLDPDAVLSRGLKSQCYDLLPGLFCGVFLFLGVLILGDLLTRKKGYLLFCILPICISAARMIANEQYMSKYYLKDALYVAEAYDAFLLLRILALAEAISLGALLLLTLLLLRRLIRTHTAVVYEGEQARGLSERATKALHGRLDKKILLCLIFFILAAIAGAFFLWMQLQFSDLWILATVLGALAVCFFFSLLNEIKEQLSVSYAREGVNKS